MGRRRWRFATIAAFLLFIIKDTKSQDENDFFYAPVERNFAQVQPPLFPSNRPSTFYEQDNYRVAPTVQQPLYNDGRVRFPSPNYNQNPQPFQLPTGRSQNSPQYYVNQPEFPAPQRQRYRPALPFNYQLQPATTKRPDVSQIHSIAYQNDPSKPETFLGQITLNNPDIDYLQNSRFKNIPFDGNSLKINGQTGHISHDEDIDNQDLFDQPKVTTYNPNRNTNRLQVNNKPNTRYNRPVDDHAITENLPPKIYGQKSKPKLSDSNKNQFNPASTEYKELLDIEPLLEDDISDISSFRELMKNNQGSFDVQVIKSNNSNDSTLEEDSKPDATSMNADNMIKNTNFGSSNKKTFNDVPKLTTTSTSTESIVSHEELSHDDNENEEAGEEEYVEYYDDNESPDNKHTTTSKPHSSEQVTDIYDDYDSTEEPEPTTDEIKANKTETFDILVMKSNKTMVKDDNFKEFVDTTIIDQTEPALSNESSEISTSLPVSYEDVSSGENPSILGHEVVSVVTTKSVVNGTISIPEVNYPTSTIKINALNDNFSVIDNNSSLIPTTTENWVVVASVQTSRSVSGARFLPFPAVEQEEKKQLLTDEDEQVEEDEENVTQDPLQNTNSSISSSSSTENINDKLDSIQSELSSAVLSGSLNNENKNIELLTETTTEASNVTTTTTTVGPLNVFTLKTTATTSETEKSAPDPLPVLIKKFIPHVTTTSTSTTARPKKKPSLVTVMDDLAAFLPPGYKSKLSYKDKRTSTTSTTTSTTTPKPTTTSTTTRETPSTPTSKFIPNNTQARSSGINSKNRVIVLDDKSLLPKEYRSKENKPQDELFKTLPKDDLNKFLPPGYKPTKDTSKTEDNIKDTIENVQKVDISAFLPKDFKFNESLSTESKPKSNPKVPIKPSPLDITALLPPGYKLNETSMESAEKAEDPLVKFKVADISNLLPPGFNLNLTESLESLESPSSSTTHSPGGFKLVFPSRPGGKTTRKPTIRQNTSVGPVPVTPKIQKGWPTRASTEFTGWPSVSTTPFSLDKLLETIKSTSPLPIHEDIQEITTRQTTTSTTTTTPKPTPPTTPGICREQCDIAATIKIVSGAKWVPELLDHHTEEWQNLAKEIKTELNSVYSKSDLLKKWYKGVRIDSFSEGSVLVDYIIELNEVEDKVDTLALKSMFHKSLIEATPGSVVETVEEESKEFDPDVMQGDQPEEERMKKSNEKMTKTIDKSAGKLEIGKFVMDPAYTEFIVLPKREEPKIVEQEEEAFLPQWGIAVIVIALASLLFVVIFGVTVLVNRQKSAKAKQPIPLSEDMLRELDKSHMGGYDDMHQMKERDLPYIPSGKRMSTAFIEQLAYSNPGDSWRSEWTPQMQKYMQYYTPDSGRGSQIYGQTGNQYGYGGGGGSQIYGQSGGGGGGGGGSQVYGYTGDYLRAQYPRRRSDYDSNF